MYDIVDEEHTDFPDAQLPRSHGTQRQHHRDNTYLQPIYTEPHTNIQPPQVCTNFSLSQRETNTTNGLLDSGFNGYLTPTHKNRRRRCNVKTNTLLYKFLISLLLNVAFIAVFTTSLYDFLNCCTGNSPPNHQPHTQLPQVVSQGYDICFFNQGGRCTGEIPTQGMRAWYANGYSDITHQDDHPTLCCYKKSKAIKQLTYLMLLVKAHNKVRRVCLNCSTQHIARSSDLSTACSIKASEEKLKLIVDDYSNNVCHQGGIRVKRTRVHFMYLYLAINCSLHGNNVIKAGVKVQDQLIAETDMKCDTNIGVMTISLFSFRNLEEETVLVPYVSHTKCVQSDTKSNRFEILAV
ncbi:uncharacterized protein [Argopecten irradians]|uniref:uncharacterized protein n=1 Tax=Argopecten irradians TaxID=31199 RepID=UPI003721B79F